MSLNSKALLRVAADIGGTFTDVAVEDGTTRYTAKVLTTPRAPEEGVLDGLAAALEKAGKGITDVDVFLHGTTLATNALIERKGATLAFVTTEGFRDVLETGYEKRFEQYDVFMDRPPPLVPRHRRLTVTERMAADGSVLTELDEGALEAMVPILKAEGVEAVAIGFLHSYVNTAHERRAREVLAAHLPDVAITISSDVSPEIREYDRFSTACANAYVQPLMAGYLGRLSATMEGLGFRGALLLMMSGGGLTTLETAQRLPIRLVESGPAGGAILASHIARENGLDEVLSFDMGGTTAKICLIADGEPERARVFEVARAYRNLKGSGWPVRIPVIEMVEIGAGGGSIARVDAMQRITVGPDSAGSEPGPACYGRGGIDATVTDANLALGRLNAAEFAGGRFTLDPARANAAVADAVGQPLGLSDAWAAAGISEIVEENMANAARVHAIERGRTIDRHVMIAFGGAAPLHATRLATKLGIRRVVVPKGAGVGSAIGFLRAPVSYQVVRSQQQTLANADVAPVNLMLTDMEAEARDIVTPGAPGAAFDVTREVDLRYVGQGHELTVRVPLGSIGDSEVGSMITAFEKLYRAHYGLIIPDMVVEALTWSVTVASKVEPSDAVTINEAGGATGKPIGTRALFEPIRGESAEIPEFWRNNLAAGQMIDGPAFIAEDDTTTVVDRGWRVFVDARGYLNLERTEAV
ncbi:MAG: hydantoinase/oxoprolinase family protein [Alphaproteobacteria bacterium]|nr:hydantoinase/oxoprolinase family protein [Alphaproteobacteria bacterium]